MVTGMLSILNQMFKKASEDKNLIFFLYLYLSRFIEAFSIKFRFSKCLYKIYFWDPSRSVEELSFESLNCEFIC